MSVEAVEQVVERDGVSIGTWWCPPDSPLWDQENKIVRGPMIVLPLTAVEIQPRDARSIVTSSARVMFYNRGQPYRRHLLHQEGDRCLYFGLPPQTVHEALEAHEAPARDHWAQPFEWTWGPIQPRVFLRALVLHRRVRAAPDGVLEAVLTLLDAVVGEAAALHAGRRAKPLRIGRKTQDAVDETLRFLVMNPEQPMTLADLGRRVDLSPFHLARSFRASTGMSVHECRDRMRVLSALRRLEGPARLIDIAMDAGYSSHSHLTQAFQRVLGEPPSAIRRRLAAAVR